MSVDWRTWVYEALSTDGRVTTLVPAERILGAGSVEGSSFKKPFMVILFGQTLPGPYPGSETSEAVVWVHDEPGDYLAIDAIQRALQSVLSGQVGIPEGLSCQWNGDSIDLSDDILGTITRNSTFTFSSVKDNQ